MRVIIFDRELHEAITVVEIPANLMREVVENRRRHIYVLPEPEPVPDFRACMEPTAMGLRPVCLNMEPVYRGRDEIIFWYAYPDDPELALRLRAAFLPGQIGEVQRREEQAYLTGLFAGAFL